MHTNLSFSNEIRGYFATNKIIQAMPQAQATAKCLCKTIPKVIYDTDVEMHFFILTIFLRKSTYRNDKCLQNTVALKGTVQKFFVRHA